MFKHFNDKHNVSLIEYYKKYHKLLESGVEPQETPETEDATYQKPDTSVSSESASDTEEVGMEQVWPLTVCFCFCLKPLKCLLGLTQRYSHSHAF